MPVQRAQYRHMKIIERNNYNDNFKIEQNKSLTVLTVVLLLHLKNKAFLKKKHMFIKQILYLEYL